MEKIPVFTDDPGWHGECLKKAFYERGIEAVFISLKSVVFSVESGKVRIEIPSFDKLPKYAFVRGVPGGTLQQVIARLNILHILKDSGVKVFNDGRAIERTVDKSMTSYLMAKHHIPTPDTWMCESRQEAQLLCERLIYPQSGLVIKPLFGSQGKGVQRINSVHELPVPMMPHVDGVYYLQRYIDSGENDWHDYRVFVVNHQAIAAMRRHGQTWVNNIALGGRGELVNPEGSLKDLAEAASRALDMDYCGVDLMKGLDGRWWVIEVNSIPAWQGLQKVTDFSIAQHLVNALLDHKTP
jgi:tetrahydromethanopterin:alpha-L-glutamate ligase